jgi:hypothetical protein
MKPEELLANEIAATEGWRGQVYQQLVDLLCRTAPSLKLQWKWNSAIWSGKKDVISISPFKEHVKINFFRGAHLADFQSVFNNGLESKNSRSIDSFSGETVDEGLVEQVIRAAVAYDEQAS